MVLCSQLFNGMFGDESFECNRPASLSITHNFYFTLGNLSVRLASCAFREEKVSEKKRCQDSFFV